MHVVMSKPDSNTVIVSYFSNEYADYLLSGFDIVFQGVKKECIEFLDNLDNN